MNFNGRLSIAAAIGAATLAAVVGCSSVAAPTGSGITTVEPTTSSSVRPAATSAPKSPASPTATNKPVDVTVVPEGETTVRLGGPPIRFRVTLVNNGADIAKMGMVVSLGHCSCGPPGASMMARGTMRMLDPQTNDWVTVPYVREGTGMDYITQNLVPPFPLSHGQTVTYELEMAVDAEQDMTVTDGETSIGVTLTDPEDPMEGPSLGGGGYHPITVETS
jgi:hypothetical protein